MISFLCEISGIFFLIIVKVSSIDSDLGYGHKCRSGSIHTDTHTHTHMYVCMYIFVCVCVCVCGYMECTWAFPCVGGWVGVKGGDMVTASVSLLIMVS